MNQFEMVAIIVIAVMIASVFRGQIWLRASGAAGEVKPDFGRRPSRNASPARGSEAAEGADQRTWSASLSRREFAGTRRSRNCAIS